MRDVETALERGAVAPGDRLPPVRALAGELGLSPTTVAAAYRELRRRGLAVGQGRRGTRISRRPPIGDRVAFAAPPGVVDLTTGNPDPALLPPLAWAFEAGAPDAHLYGEDPAWDPLLRLVAESLARSAIPAEHLVAVNGAMDGIERLLATRLRAGDRVIVEDPTYAHLIDLVRAQGLVPLGVPVDDAGPDPQAVAQALPRAAAAVLTPRAHNPTGARITAARATELRAALRRHPHVLVIENDHSPEVAGTEHHPLIAGLERWAVLRSVSKNLTPDLRLAVVAGDASTVARVEGRLGLGAGWVSHIVQTLAWRLMADARTHALTARAAALYAERRTALVEALADEGIAARGASGLNVWIPVREEAATTQQLLARGWALKPGEGYRLASAPFVRATTASLAPERARALARDLAAIMRPGRAHGRDQPRSTAGRRVG